MSMDRIVEAWNGFGRLRLGSLSSSTSLDAQPADPLKPLATAFRAVWPLRLQPQEFMVLLLDGIAHHYRPSCTERPKALPYSPPGASSSQHHEPGLLVSASANQATPSTQALLHDHVDNALP